jgi:hypothetical protein
MFSAIWVSTGKSVSATLTHRALHPVVINEMLNTAANTILLCEFTFMSVFLLIEFCVIWICGIAASHVGTAAPGCPAEGSPALWLLAKQNRHQPKPMAIAMKILN